MARSHGFRGLPRPLRRSDAHFLASRIRNPVPQYSTIAVWGAHFDSKPYDRDPSQGLLKAIMYNPSYQVTVVQVVVS